MAMSAYNQEVTKAKAAAAVMLKIFMRYLPAKASRALILAKR